MTNREAAALIREIARAVAKNNRVCPDDFKIINENDCFAKIRFEVAVDRADECIKALPLLKETLILLLGEDVVSFDFVERCKHSLWLLKRNIRNGCSTDMINDKAPWKDITVEDYRKVADILDMADRIEKLMRTVTK